MIRTTMLLMVAVAAGCLGSGDDAESAGSQVFGTLPPQTGPKCQDGVLEGDEECEEGVPCESGYCDRCRCVEIGNTVSASECGSHCLEFGYSLGSMTQDGNCSYALGAQDVCAVKCSYRKAFPSDEQGRVCCCRSLKYVRCQESVFEEGCDCPSQAESVEICRKNKPGG